MPSAIELLKGIGLLSATALGALVLSTLGASPAFAEKTAAQIKCEEEGGTWSDKGEGNTFCFKKLPPMTRATPGGASPTGATAADHAIKTKGTGASGRMAGAVTFTVTGTYSDGNTRRLKVRTDSNTDGGMTSTDGELHVTCARGLVAAAAFSDGETGSEQATGKRQHQPVSFVKANAVYRGTWDLKEAKGHYAESRLASSRPVVLDSSAAGLCR
jgi:hypothetical protein